MKNYPAALGLLLAVAAVPAQAQTAVQATLVQDFVTTPDEIGSWPRDFSTVDGKVYFSAERPSSGRELFVIDAPGGQPRLLAELAPGGASSDPRALGKAGNRLIVAASVGNRAPDELMGALVPYALDPATGETTLLYNLPAESVGGFADKLLLYSDSDNVLLATDGTAAGTQRLLQAAPGFLSYLPRSENYVCTLADGAMFMGFHEGAWRLWLTNGQRLGTGIIATLPELLPVAARAGNGGCYFLTYRSSGGWALWQSNGTTPGTGIVAESADGTPLDLAVLDTGVLVLDTPAKLRSRLWRVGSSTPLLDHTGNFPGKFHRQGQRVLVTTQSWSENYPVFVSDGTPEGTRAVQRVDGEPLLLQPTSNPTFVAVGERILTDDPSTTWRIDLASATAEPVSLDGYMDLSDSAVLGTDVLAAGYVLGSGAEPWRTDGSSAGTQRVADLATATKGGMDTGEAVVFGTVLVLSQVGATDAQDVHHGELWRTDGSPEGTWALPSSVYGGGSVEQVQKLGNQVIFSADTVPRSGVRQLYRTRSDLLETTPLAATTLAGSEYLRSVGDNNTAAMFSCGTPGGQRDLCGVGAGDDQILTLQYALSGTPEPVGNLAGLSLYFVPGLGLMRSDGTAAGTALLRSGLASHQSLSQPLISQRLGSRLLFHACEGAICGLWSSDGTPGGTQQMYPLSYYIHGYAQLGNRVLFLTTDGYWQLWSTDGTAAGTRVVTRLWRRATSITTVGNYVHLGGADDYLISDGTEAGTRIVPRLPSLFPSFGTPIALDANTALFGCSPITHGAELCAVDADGSNLRIATDIYQGPRSSFPALVARTADALYFAAYDGAHGRELWRVSAVTDVIFADGFTH